MTLADHSPGADLLLHCTLERTVVRTRNPATGQVEVLKLLLRGSLNDAEREFEMGRLAAGPGSVRYLSASLDPQTGRPCLRTEFHPGADLEALVARRGAFDAATACRMLAPVAETLAELHATRTAALPQGLCHGDIKPSNLLRTDSTTLLLDFEHSGPIATGRCAGTVGFAGPEAQAGGLLTPGFDVFGLGASLHWLLSGQTPTPGALAAQDLELQMLVAACTAKSPAVRPNASAVARKLHELAQRLAQDPAEPVRNALLSGELETCRQLLEAPGIHAGTRENLLALLQRSERFLARLPGIAEIWAPIGEQSELALTTRRMFQLESFLQRFPRHPAAISARLSVKDHAGKLMQRSLPKLTEHVRAEDFAAARALLTNLEALARAVLATPGRLRVPGDHDPRMPTLLQRAPLSCLQQEAQRIASATSESDKIAAAIEQAESKLALDEAEAIIDRFASHHGGTSAAVTRRRDRLHRLGFYLERISRANSNLERLRELLPKADLKPLFAVVLECTTAAARAHRDDEGGGAMGMRQLHLALTNLGDEFASLRSRVAPAHECLRGALETLTDEAWSILADAQQKLQAEPVPVRPLQLLLGRLDTFRVLETLIDRPGHARSQLVDRIESLRLRLEQALAQRDRLARGAEQAMAKGHWTTGLFEMERAVTSVDGEDSAESHEAAKLRERLAQARKRKEEIEQAQRRNIELETNYAAMLADSQSRSSERLRILRERRDCLQFLAVHSQKDRGELYARDLRAVEQRITEEQAMQAGKSFEASTDLDERLLLARQTLAQIDAFRQEGDPNVAPPEEIRALSELWQQRLTTTLAAVDQRTALALAQTRRRQRWMRAAAMLLVLGVGGTLALVLQPSAVSAQETRLSQIDLGAVEQARGPALTDLRTFAGDNEHANKAIDRLATVQRGIDFAAWHHGLAQDLCMPGLPKGFAAQCWRIGLGLAVAATDNDAEARTALRTAVELDSRLLAGHGIQLAKDAKLRLGLR